MMDEYDYSGERFLYKIYPILKDSDEVKHKTNNTDSIKNIKRYMNRLERTHKNVVNKNKLSRLLKFYYEKYVIKPEDIDSNSLHGTTVEDIISEQKKTLTSWISYFTSPGANYPVWAKYWAFQGMLRMGTYNEATGRYNKRANKTVKPFVDCNPELVAKAIDLIIKYNHGQELNDKEIEKLVSTGSFSKIYGKLLQNYKEAKNVQSNSKDGIWIKYNQGSEEDAKKLCASLQDKGTGWCTASEATAVDQICGRDGYEGGDFYVYYTKDEQGKYTMPRIAIRMDGTDYIGEIRGVDESQNLEDGLEDIVEEKLNNIKNLNVEDRNNALITCEKLKKLSVINKKTYNGEILTQEESIMLYNGEQIGFGWGQEPRVERIIKERKNRKLIFSDFEIFDFDTAKFILCKDWRLFQYISTNIEGYKELCVVAVNQNSDVLQYISKEYATKNTKEYREIVVVAVQKNTNVLKYVPEELRDKELCLDAVKRNGYVLEYVPIKLRDKSICLAAVKQNYNSLAYVPNELVDKEICLAAVKQYGYALQYVPEKLIDKEMCIEAVMENGYALGYVPKEIIDKEIYIAAVSQNSNLLCYAPKELIDKEISLAAVKQNGNALRYIPKEIIDKEICLAAVKQKGQVLASVPIELKDKEMCLAAVKQNGYVLWHMPKQLIDEEICLEAVKQNGNALQYVPTNLMNIEICIEAAKQNDNALEYVPTNLRNREIYLEVVKQNGYALRHIPKELIDKEICLSAVKQDADALMFVPNYLKQSILNEIGSNENFSSMRK